MRVRLLLALAWLAFAPLGGCANMIDRLMHVGQAPELTPIENPVAQPSYRPVSLPMPAHEPEIYPANSLWRQLDRRPARGFDQPRCNGSPCPANFPRERAAADGRRAPPRATPDEVDPFRLAPLPRSSGKIALVNRVGAALSGR